MTVPSAGFRRASAMVPAVLAAAALAAPAAASAAPTIQVSGGTYTVNAGQAFTENGLASWTDANGFYLARDFTATISWGDGTPRQNATVVNYGCGQGDVCPYVNGSHTYARAGTYIPTITVTDRLGATGSGTAYFTVRSCFLGIIC